MNDEIIYNFDRVDGKELPNKYSQIKTEFHLGQLFHDGKKLYLISAIDWQKQLIHFRHLKKEDLRLYEIPELK